MKKRLLSTLAVLAFTSYLTGAWAQDEHRHAGRAHEGPLHLSEDLAALLSEEMVAIDEGMRVLVTALAAGDWKRVGTTAEQIEKSYILSQKLSAEQIEELHRALPSRFTELDSAFHRTAGNLAHAARERNRELAAFYLYKLVDTCVECHAAYAQDRFPGFGQERDDGHRH